MGNAGAPVKCGHRCAATACLPRLKPHSHPAPPACRARSPADEIGVELPSLRLDSQAKYGALSRGDASIFMRFPDASYREKIWDHCAGVAIIEVRGRWWGSSPKRRGAGSWVCTASVLGTRGPTGPTPTATSPAATQHHHNTTQAHNTHTHNHPILQEAGAVISDALGNPLDFSQGRFFPDLNGGIVAATPSMHRAIMAAIRKIRGLPPREQQAEQ